MNRIVLFLLLLLSFTVSAQNKPIAIKNVNIIPMTVDNRIIENATIVIQDNKILSINKPIPAKAKVINGQGKWLIPGLIDMHVHGLADIDFGKKYPTKGATLFVNNQDYFTLYVASGVTTIFDLIARAENFAQRNEINEGKVIGPRMALASIIEGEEGTGKIATTPSDGRQSVRMAKAEGYDFIKVYAHLDIETFKAVVDEAHKQGMKVIGHIPEVFKGRTEEAFVPHFDMVAHAEEFFKQTDDLTDKEAQRFAKLAKENRTWLTPTLIVNESIAEQYRSLDSIRDLPELKYVIPLMQNKWLTANQYNKASSPEKIARNETRIEFNNKLVKAFKEAGVPIVAGTDAGTSGIIWGFSLHDEIELLVKAGLTPEEALASATRLPATWLEIGDKIGTIEEGKFADLILLDANPLLDIKNTRKISAVCFNGRWVNRKTIDKMLSGLAKHNAHPTDKDNWSKRKDY